MAQSASQNYELHPAEVKTLPANPATVDDTLPLVPGIVRSPTGELKLDGSGEERSSLVVNQSDVTDPATGKFGQTVPIDSVRNGRDVLSYFPSSRSTGASHRPSSRWRPNAAAINGMPI